MKKNLLIGASFVAVLVVLGIAESVTQRVAAAQAQNAVMAPRFEVDPTFPKPLPNGWYQGQTIGLWVESSRRICNSLPTMVYRLTRFSSSRMFPGQEYSIIRWMAMSLNGAGRLL